MEKTIVLEKRHCPYLSKKQLAVELGYGETSIYKLIKGFEFLIYWTPSHGTIRKINYRFFFLILHQKIYNIL